MDRVRTGAQAVELRQPKGEQEAHDIFLRHHARLVRLCVLLTGRAQFAEELAQEIFSRCFARVGSLSEEDQYPYLRAAASNLWKNRLRRLALEHRRHPANVETTTELSVEDRDELWSAVAHLPVRQRACLVLRFYEDLSERETAEALGCSVGTSRVRRAERSLDYARS